MIQLIISGQVARMQSRRGRPRHYDLLAASLTVLEYRPGDHIRVLLALCYSDDALLRPRSSALRPSSSTSSCVLAKRWIGSLSGASR